MNKKIIDIGQYYSKGRRVYNAISMAKNNYWEKNI